MCRLLDISRQTYYNYINNIHVNKLKRINEIDFNVKRTFNNSYHSFGTRMIKATLNREGINYSRSTIAKSMQRQNLISSYNIKRKPKYNNPNRAKIANKLNQQFNQRLHTVLTSDLTYVNVNGKHNYICFIIDIYNSEIVGYSCLDKKTPQIVIDAFKRVKFSLNEVELFHTDRGTEFKNKRIDKLLDFYKIERSLSAPGNPVDNAVSESVFKTFKYAWNKKQKYKSEIELKIDVDNFVRWYNNIRVHSKLNYQSPVEYRLKDN